MLRAGVYRRHTENLGVPESVSPHATWEYSRIRPPSLSRRRTRGFELRSGTPQVSARIQHAARKQWEMTGMIRAIRTRERGCPARTWDDRLRCSDPVKPQVRLPDVEPGKRPPDDHPLDLAGALEDREDRGLRDSFRRSVACQGPWCQHGFSTGCRDWQRFPAASGADSPRLEAGEGRLGWTDWRRMS
jgi:hypothetical protein